MMADRNWVFAAIRHLTLFPHQALVRPGTGLMVLLIAVAGCKGAPARIVGGIADTVVVNTMRPVPLPIRLLDRKGHLLDSSGVRYRRTGGAAMPVSANGVVTCAQPGDATVYASLGAISARLLVRCRPVTKVRGLRMMSLVVGDPAVDLPFDALGVDGRPISPLAAQVTIGDSTVATLEGQRLRARAPGETGVTMRVGDREGFVQVHAFEIGRTPEGVRPGQHVAVRVRLSGGEMRKWKLSASPELYYVEMLANSNIHEMPSLAIAGANCGLGGLRENSYFCLVQHDASVIVYHRQRVDPAQVVMGTLLVWRQGRP